MYKPPEFNPLQSQLLAAKDPLEQLRLISGARLDSVDTAIGYFQGAARTLTPGAERSGLLAEKSSQAIDTANAAGYSLGAAETSESSTQLGRQDKQANIFRSRRRNRGVSDVEAEIKRL